MAQYFPPTEDVPIFDTNLFEDPNEYLTVTKANGKYLKYPNAQGTENLQAITVSGTALFNSTLQATGTSTFSGTVNNLLPVYFGGVGLGGEIIIINPLGGYGLDVQATGTGIDWYGQGNAYVQRMRATIYMYPDFTFAFWNGTTQALQMLNAIANPTTTLLLTDPTCQTVLGGKWRVRGNTASTFGLLDLVTTTADAMTMYVDPSSGNPTMSTLYGTFDYIEPLVTAPALSNPIFRLCANKKTGAIVADTIGQLAFAGYDGVGATPIIGASIQVNPSAVWTATNHGTNMTFSTTLSSTIVNRPVMTLTPAGYLRIGVSATTALAPLHITTTNGSTPMVIVDGGATSTNLAAILIANNYATTGTTAQNIAVAMVKAVGNYNNSSLVGDGIVRVDNIAGTTFNRLLLSAVASTPPVVIDSSNIMRIGNETITSVGTAPLSVSCNTVNTPCLFVRGLNTGATNGGYIELQPPNNVTDRIGIFSSGLGDLTFNSSRAASTLTIQNFNLASTTNAINDCGTATAYWKNVRGLNAYITVSDERKKIEIKQVPLGLDFINDLKPVSYKWKDNTDREHYGLIAQDVKASLDKKGCGEAGLWCLSDKDDSESFQALRYTELISPMIQAIKELTEMNKMLMDRIIILESKSL